MSWTTVSKDREHDECVAALRSAGFLVEEMCAAFDLLVGNPDNFKLMVLELKNKPNRPSDVRFTPTQKRVLREWAGFPIRVAYGPEDAVATAREVLGVAPRPAPADETLAERLKRLAKPATHHGAPK